MTTDSPQQRVRLVLVDDHEVVRAGLRSLLSEEAGLEIIGEAGSVREAIDVLDELQPDVVLLDVRLGLESGFEVCRSTRAKHPQVRVLILTSYPNAGFVSEAIAADAHGYLLKDANRLALIHAIRQVAAGQSVLDPAVTGGVLKRLKNGEEQHERPGRLRLLSGQEHRVMELVAQGMTNKEIADVMGLSDKTVKNYLSNAMEKLGIHRRSQAVAYFLHHQAGTNLS